MRDLCLCVDLGCLCGKFVKFMCHINPGCMYKHEKDERIEILELRRHEAPKNRWVSQFFFSNLQLVHLSTPVLSVGVGWVSAEGEVSTVSPDRVAQLYQGDPLIDVVPVVQHRAMLALVDVHFHLLVVADGRGGDGLPQRLLAMLERDHGGRDLERAMSSSTVALN